MEDVFFAHDAIEVEIRRKLDAMRTPLRELGAALERELEPRGLWTSEVRDAFATLLEEARDEDTAAYGRHAVRVCAGLARALLDPDGAWMVLALAHNVDEVERLAGLREQLDERGRWALTLLTIDRDREREEAYLTGYYDAIAAWPELLVLKGCDKLDNLLSYVLDDLDPYHFRVVTDHVCPRLLAVDEALSRSLAVAVQAATDPQMQERFRSEIRQTESGT